MSEDYEALRQRICRLEVQIDSTAVVVQKFRETEKWLGSWCKDILGVLDAASIEIPERLRTHVPVTGRGSSEAGVESPDSGAGGVQSLRSVAESADDDTATHERSMRGDKT